jgi:hypothetical protein
MTDTAFTFGIAAESASDAARVSRLVDALLAREVDWFGDQRETLRRWRGVEPHTEYFNVHGWGDALRARRLKVHGKFGGGAEERQARAIVILFANAALPPHALVYCRDTDGDDDRRVAIRAAIEASPLGRPTAVACAHPELEAWLVAGFEPESDAERTRLATERATLGFDPVSRSHELSSTADVSKRDTKQVLARLLADDDHDRRERCATRALHEAASVGQHNGLDAFVSDVRAQLVPLVKGR